MLRPQNRIRPYTQHHACDICRNILHTSPGDSVFLNFSASKSRVSVIRRNRLHRCGPIKVVIFHLQGLAQWSVMGTNFKETSGLRSVAFLCRVETGLPQHFPRPNAHRPAVKIVPLSAWACRQPHRKASAASAGAGPVMHRCTGPSFCDYFKYGASASCFCPLSTGQTDAD